MESVEFENGNVTDPLFDEIHTKNMSWCFDMLTFYRSLDDPESRKVLSQLEKYAQFSFFINGVVTCILASFGLFGNLILVIQIRRSKHFSRRLAAHLAMLCAWDMALLLSCLLTYGIISLYYGIIPLVGIVAYLLYFFQPFASFCVTGTIWQVLAITIERYTAVSKPLELRTRHSQFSVKVICLFIVIGAFILNMTVVPLERTLTECYDFTTSGLDFRTMIIQLDLAHNQTYAILVHLIPDIIFRAPTPIIAMAILTVRTLQICNRRTIGTQTIQTRRNVPLMLTLLNMKFILCNTLYLFNTILMEVMGYGGRTSSQQNELNMEQYIRSLYLTDFSNMLLALHSATNWLIFYRWPKVASTAKKYSHFTMTSYTSTKTSVVDCEIAQLIQTRFVANKKRVCTEILATLCADSIHIARKLMDEEITHKQTKEFYTKQAAIQKHGEKLASVIEEILSSLALRNTSIAIMRDLCRQIGYKYYKVNVHCSVEHWKIVRSILVSDILQAHGINKNHTNKPLLQMQPAALQKAFNKIFNLALREIKSGALCAMVDASRSNLRHQSDGMILNTIERNHDGIRLHSKLRASLKMSDPTQIGKLYRNKDKRRSGRNLYNSLTNDPRTISSDSVETFLSTPRSGQASSEHWQDSYCIGVQEFNLSLFDQTSPRSANSDIN